MHVWNYNETIEYGFEPRTKKRNKKSKLLHINPNVIGDGVFKCKP
jgi:hypothetical protein